MHFNLARVCVLIALASPLASAASFSFAGSFEADDSVQLFRFTLASTSDITLRTYSYAGGINGAGTAIPRGGFDPILSLFDSAGVFINENDDGYSNVPADSITGQHFDSYIFTTLATGTYTVSITQYDNFASGLNLSNGFSKAGNSNFTSGEFHCSNGKFCDATGDNRTSNWEFDVQGVASAIVVNTPEPGTTALLGIGMLLIVVGRRKAWSIFSRQ